MRINENCFPAEKWGRLTGNDDAFDIMSANQEVHGQPITPTAPKDGTTVGASEESLMAESQNQVESASIWIEGAYPERENPQNATVRQTSCSLHPQRGSRSPVGLTINALTRSEGQNEPDTINAVERMDI